jgi:hypothetical protein
MGAGCAPSDDTVAGMEDLTELVEDVKNIHPGPETDFRVVHEEAGELGKLEKREGGERLGPTEKLGKKEQSFVGSHRYRKGPTVDENAAEKALVGQKKVEFLQG